MRVLIVGAGIGGLTLALALQRQGLRPTILEDAAALTAVGAGVQLGPNATRVLESFGLLPALRRSAFTPEAATVLSGSSGRRRASLPLGEAAVRRWGAPYLSLHRADLQAVLLEAVRRLDAAEIVLGARVAAVEPGAVVLEGGERREADLIVGADGVRSRVRSAVCSTAPRSLGEVAWRALVPTQDDPPQARVWTWAQRHLVAYPVQGGRSLNLVAVTRGTLTGERWSEPGDPDALRAAFSDACPAVRRLLAKVEATSRWALTDLPPLPRWTAEGVVLLGDAAHAMAPYLAQGAAMAIEDAEALARHLAAPGALPSRLAAYEAERRPRGEAVQAASRRNGVVFHLPSPVSALAFAAAAVLDAPRGGAAARLDWLYGYRPPA